MGEVYRARDTKLGRDVALKVLPDVLVRDSERMARLRREAQVLASLNHANIAAIYGIEESDGRLTLVLECVDGETLAERIAKGPLPVLEALKVALQIAEALEAAHEKAVIHRDLKPANVKITPEGAVKVLDFGLAKALGDDPGASPNFSQSPTLSAALTGAGFILGTAGYMAPEQARGKGADRRADIWSFGVILFEMLAGRRLFEGETVADTLAKVLEREPDLRQLPAHTPGGVRRLVQRCLNKNVKNRLQAIGDARTLIEEILSDPSALAEDAPAPQYPTWKKVLPWAAALILAAGWVLSSLRTAPSKNPLVRFDFILPDEQTLTHEFRHGLTLSPDGKRVAFVANKPGRPIAERRIYVKAIDQWEAVPIPGTEGGLNPFFSPDGEWLGFLSGSQIKKVQLNGATPVTTVADVGPRRLTGLTWGQNGTIVFAPAAAGGLKVVRDSGGEPEEFTTLDTTMNEVSHRLPHFLPDGSGVLFTVLRYTYIEPNWSSAQVWAKSLKSGERRLVLENAADGRYLDSGYLVFVREGRLFAVRFGPETLSVTGTAAPVLEGVSQAMYSTSSVEDFTGAAQFSIAQNGSVAFAPGGIEPPRMHSLVWVDRHGRVTPLGNKPVAFSPVRVSSNGKMVAFAECCRGKEDIWIFDTERQLLERQISEGQTFRPIWSPDGSRFAFRSNRDGPSQIYVKQMDSPGLTAITPGPHDEPGSWTPDGKEFAFAHGEFSKGAFSYDLYISSLASPNQPRVLIKSAANESYPEFSPDGRWLAYCSDETGRNEVFVQPYPGPGKRVQISIAGGAEPAWSRDGKEVFYRSADANMMSVHFAASDKEFIPEKPAVLFAWKFEVGIIGRAYDVAPDGRFLVMQRIPDLEAEWRRKVFPATIRVVLNWTDELRRIMNR
jgi:serine/threonine-protein kinase